MISSHGDALGRLLQYLSMGLTPGDKIGPYEVTGTLGAGGMGEVYRAKDTKLGRNVALKVLPAALANDSEYLARFQREARVLASLNHPNIAAIYGLEEKAIIMELVEGRTLAELGALPLEEALQYARQIAEALEAAHEKGIIHRDLKPANVKVTANGSVKVLDFGLAKSTEDSDAPANSQDSPTLTVRATQAGVILGTAGYMSPEQASGRAVDRRADIWSFGVVLFEMLTGKRLFSGETISHTLADVLRAEIDFSKLPPGTPPAIRDLIERCLDRKLRSRLQWIGDARVAIESFLANPVASRPTASLPARRPFGWAVATVVFALAAVASSILAWRAMRPVERPLRIFTENLGPDVALVDKTAGPSPRAAPNAVISPDGSRIAFVSQGTDGKTRLFTRRLDQKIAIRLDDTEGALAPFFSPDGQWLGYFSNGKLKKVPTEAGSSVELCSAATQLGASWGDDGNIIAALSPISPLSRVPEAGGVPAPVTKLEPGEVSHRWVQVLPGARAIVYAAGLPGRFDAARIVAQRLDTGERKVIRTQATFPRYLSSGHLLFATNGTIYAAAFDADRLEIRGTPVPVLQDARSALDSGGTQLDASREGTVIYRSTAGALVSPTVRWVSPAGMGEILLSGPARYATPILSPDEKLIAFRILESGRTNIWIHDVARNQARRLTFEGEDQYTPLWTPDGRRVVYSTPTGIYWIRADGGGKPVRLADAGWPQWFTSDGKRFCYDTGGSSERSCNIVTIGGDPEQPQTGKAEPCFSTRIPLTTGSDLSPDGRWIAYGAVESGEMQIFVRSFPDRGGVWQISTAGGVIPKWSADGRQLYFLDLDNHLMVASTQSKGDSFIADRPRRWTDLKFEIAPGLTMNYSPSRDNKRILMVVDPAAGEKSDANLKVVLNFSDEVRRRLQGPGAK